MSKKGLEKEEELEIRLPTFAGLKRNQGIFRENIYLYFIDYVKIFDCVAHGKLWKALKEMGIPDHLTGLLRNLGVKKQLRGQEVCGSRSNSSVWNN